MTTRSLRIAIAGWGSTGDIMPLVAVSDVLRRRGHAVTVLANPAFAGAIRDADADFLPIGAQADHEALLADSSLFGADREPWGAIFGRHYYPRVRDFYDAVRGLATEGLDVIVAEEVGAASAAEHSGIPRASLATSSVRFLSRHDPPHPERMLPDGLQWMARSPRWTGLYMRWLFARQGMWRWPLRRRALPESHPLGAFRRDIGLGLRLPSADLVVGLWPEWFSPPQPDWPPNTVATGFALYPPPVLSSVSDDERRRGPIVATTGSVAGDQRGFYDAVVAACRALSREALLVTPHATHVPNDLPPGVSHVPHVPFGDAFARASLVIHHGGIGTAAYGLAAGVPQIVVPMRGDQFDNGNRLVRLGVAAMVAIDPARTDEFVGTVRRMLTSDDVAEACRRWREASRDTGAGLRGAADRIEALAR